MNDPLHSGSPKDAYELIEKIGTGAEGVVWKARLKKSGLENDFVAIKMLYPQGNDDDFIRRARHQAIILEGFDHPNIVRYRDFVVWDDTGMHGAMPCLVTEYLEGEDLKCRLNALDGRGLPWDEARSIAHACLEALIHARSRGVTHCDIKPSNIFLCRDGVVKLIDFGISRMKRGDDMTPPTAGGWGTYDYMAPETARVNGFRPDEQSDIFSFGVCLYQMATGRLPFGSLGEDAMQGYYHRWMRSEPPVPDFRNSQARSLEKILLEFRPFINRCLAEDRANRFKTFAEAALLFQRISRRTFEAPEGARYECVRVIGQGGFGTVFEAREFPGGEPVSLKLLSEHQCAKRFEHEARMLQQHGHKNVVGYRKFFSIESMAGRSHVLVMELLPGMPESTLGNRIRAEPKGMLPINVLDLFDGYLAALEHLHACEIYHRDLKPSNLFAPADDLRAPCVLDFGIARDPDRSTITTGQIPGTPDYMPPEFAALGATRRPGASRARSRGSPQSDVYSLAVCLYEALTGTLPHPKLPKDSASAYAEFFRRAPKLAPPACDHPVFRENPQLVTVVRRGLAADPEQRYATAAAMRTALRAIRSLLDIKQGKTGTPFDQTTVAESVKGIITFADVDAGVCYECVREVGTGGFGTVYEAVERPAGERVALKVLNKIESEPRQRFADEARLLKKLHTTHPNIIQYRRSFEDASMGKPRHVLVMELLPGMPERSLAGRIEAGPLAVKELKPWFLGYLEGLEHLHRHRVYHRDIKPSNLYAPGPSDDRLPCILDFGIALDMDPDRPDWTREYVPRTPDYSAPELLRPGFRRRAERGTPRSDLYSISVCLYQALTGQLPFPKIRDGTDELKRHDRPSRPPDFSHPVFVEYPLLARLLKSGLATDPRKRPASATKYREGLVQALLPAAEDIAVTSADTETHVAGDDAPTTRDKPKRDWGKIAGRYAAAALVLAIATASVWALNAWDLQRAGKVNIRLDQLGDASLDPAWLKNFEDILAQAGSFVPFSARMKEQNRRIQGLQSDVRGLWETQARSLEFQLKEGTTTPGNAKGQLDRVRHIIQTAAKWDKSFNEADGLHQLNGLDRQTPHATNAESEWIAFENTFEQWVKEHKAFTSHATALKIRNSIKSWKDAAGRQMVQEALDDASPPMQPVPDDTWIEHMGKLAAWSKAYRQHPELSSGMRTEAGNHEDAYKRWANEQSKARVLDIATAYAALDVVEGDGKYADLTNWVARIPEDFRPSINGTSLADARSGAMRQIRESLGRLSSVDQFADWKSKHGKVGELRAAGEAQLENIVDQQLQLDPLDGRRARLEALARDGDKWRPMLPGNRAASLWERLMAEQSRAALSVINATEHTLVLGGDSIGPGNRKTIRLTPDETSRLTATVAGAGYDPIRSPIEIKPGGGYTWKISPDQLSATPVQVALLYDKSLNPPEEMPDTPDVKWTQDTERGAWIARITPPKDLVITRSRPDYRKQGPTALQVRVGQPLTLEPVSWSATDQLASLEKAQQGNPARNPDALNEYFKEGAPQFEWPGHSNQYARLKAGWMGEHKRRLIQAMEDAERQIAEQRESLFAINPASKEYAHKSQAAIQCMANPPAAVIQSSGDQARWDRVLAWKANWPGNKGALGLKLKDIGKDKSGEPYDWCNLEAAMLLNPGAPPDVNSNVMAVQAEWNRWKAHCEYSRKKEPYDQNDYLPLKHLRNAAEQRPESLSRNDLDIAMKAWKQMSDEQSRYFDEKHVYDPTINERTRGEARKKMQVNTQYLVYIMTKCMDQQARERLAKEMGSHLESLPVALTKDISMGGFQFDVETRPVAVQGGASKPPADARDGSAVASGSALLFPLCAVAGRGAFRGRDRRRRGSAMVEFVMILGSVVVPVLALLMAEFNGGGLGLLSALRHFCARLMVVIGVPFL